MSAPESTQDSHPSPGHWLMHVPAPLFAVVMGLTGLGLAWREAGHLFGLPPLIGEAVGWLAVALFVAISALYLIKTVRHFPEVKQEYNHPVRSNFFAAISICLVLVGGMVMPYSDLAARALWIAGAVVHAVMTLILLERWISREFQIVHSNPAWFIPVVGNILVPVLGVKLGYVEISWFFFSVGVVFWLVFFAVLIYRIIFHPQMPAKLLPTLFIFIAPPAVGYFSYVGLNGGEVDHFARVMVYFGLFITLLIAFMGKRFLKVPFAASWWAYTFPLDAMTIATLKYAHHTGIPFLNGLGLVLLGVTSIVVAAVFVRTLKELIAGNLFVPE